MFSLVVFFTDGTNTGAGYTSSAAGTYRITSSTDLLNWTTLEEGIAGETGSNQTSKTIPFTPDSKVFFRVEKY